MLGLLAVAACANGQADAEALLAKMRRAYASVKSARITSRTQFLSGGQRELTTQNRILYVAPRKIYIETTGIPGLTEPAFKAHADGKEYTFVGLPGGQITYPFDLRTFESRLPQLNLEVLCLWNWKRQLMTTVGNNMYRSTFRIERETWNDRDWIVLREYAADVEVRYYIDPSTYMIWRSVSKRRNQPRPYQDAQITKLELNVPIDPKLMAMPSRKI